MLKKNYKHLNTVQKGSFAEAYAKMAFTLEGFEVYTTEYDDRGIDFVIRNSTGRFYSVQVKATGHSANPFISESKFIDSEDFLVCAVRLGEGSEPSIYLARGCDWSEASDCLHYNASGGSAGPYYEMRFSNKNKQALERHSFPVYVEKLKSGGPLNTPSEVSKSQIDQLLTFLPYFKDGGDEFGENAHFDDQGSMLPSVLNEKTDEFYRACYDLGFIETFDWMAWSREKSDLVNSGIGIESLDLEDIRKLLTTHIRGDRFHDGHLLEVLRSNTITKILERLKAIRNQMS